jgi:hypothetical protein
MIRTVWLALICLIGLAMVASVKLISRPVGDSNAEPFVEDSVPPAIKTDRLSPSDVDDDPLLRNVAVQTIKIVPQASKEVIAGKAAQGVQRSAFAELRGRRHRAPRHHKRFRRHGYLRAG